MMRSEGSNLKRKREQMQQVTNETIGTEPRWIQSPSTQPITELSTMIVSNLLLCLTKIETFDSLFIHKQDQKLLYKNLAFFNHGKCGLSDERF